MSRQPAEHVPTAQSRQTVEVAAGYGVPLEMICALIGIGSVHTLYKHYRDDPAVGNLLLAGKSKAVFNVAKTLYSRATTGNDLGAACFYLKTQAGFREKHVLDDPGAVKNLYDLILMSGLSMNGPVVESEPAHRVQ